MSEGPKFEGLKASGEVAKQVITLSTGTVGFTITFLDKFTKHAENTPASVPVTLIVAWLMFGLAILLSMWTSMAITGTLGLIDRAANGSPLNADEQRAASGGAANIRLPAISMILAFLVAIVFMIWTGIGLAV